MAAMPPQELIIRIKRLGRQGRKYSRLCQLTIKTFLQSEVYSILLNRTRWCQLEVRSNRASSPSSNQTRWISRLAEWESILNPRPLKATRVKVEAFRETLMLRAPRTSGIFIIIRGKMAPVGKRTKIITIKPEILTPSLHLEMLLIWIQLMWCLPQIQVIIIIMAEHQASKVEEAIEIQQREIATWASHAAW